MLMWIPEDGTLGAMKLTKIWIWPILCFAFALRSVLLNGSFWLDEAAQVLESSRSLREQFQIAYDFQPPLFHVIVHLFTRFSIAEDWLRLVSVASGLLTIYILFEFVVLFFAPKKQFQAIHVALISALLLSVSGFHVYFSQELRPYALTAMWAALSWYSLVRASRVKTKRWWAVFVFSSVAGLYSMYVYPFLILGQVVWVWMEQRSHFRRIIVSCILISLLFLPWLPSFLEQLKIGVALQGQLPGWSDVVSVPQWKALPMVAAKFLGGMLPVDWSWSLLWTHLAPMICLALAFFGSVRGGLQKHKAVWTLFLCWVLVPVLAAWLISFRIPVLSPKRVLFTLPGLYLMAAYGWSMLRGKLRWTVIGLFFVVQLAGLGKYWTTPTLQREDWRTVITQLHGEFSSENTIVVMGWYASFSPWELYEKKQEKPFPVVFTAQVRTVEPVFLAAQMTRVEPYTNVLVLDYLRDLTDPSRSIERWLESHGYQGINSIDTKNFGFIRQYKRVPAIGSVPRPMEGSL